MIGYLTLTDQLELQKEPLKKVRFIPALRLSIFWNGPVEVCHYFHDHFVYQPHIAVIWDNRREG